MSSSLKVYKGVNDILQLVNELKTHGLIQGKDFDFSYIPYTYKKKTNDKIPRHAIFTFYKEDMASWFSLKWL
jgi:hypothetical protein